MSQRSDARASLVRRALSAAFLVAVPLVLSASCKPKAGGSCSGSVAVCADNQSALFCIDGTYQPIHCRGDKGCSQTSTTAECDESIASEKDACNAVESIACSTDKKEALRCKDKAFVLDETCKGPNGCKVDADRKVTCDNDVADVGDPCHFPGDYACTADKGLVLRCDNNKMTPLNTCRGPKQCRIVQLPQQNKVQFICDDSLAQDGDPCDTNGEEACSMDKKSLYVCKQLKFAFSRNCPGPAGCTYDEKTDRYGCDVEGSPAEPAEPAAKKHRH